ncbi:MAG TPA: MFS transporter [Nitrospirales bacterium]|nr:MFS transporter [Nitrospirales bacterium]
MADTPTPAFLSSPGRSAIPKSIWALGLVSLCMDMSSELIHSLLPVYMVTVLGASLLSVGFIEGFAEATALLTRMFSGVLSDYWRKRKLLTVIGYGMAALTKPLFPLASGLTTVFLARFLDRVGKGIRGAPRDALIGELAPPNLRGTCYGLRQSLDTVGAFLGPLMAMGLMVLLANDIRSVLWVAVIPAVLAVFLLIVGVQDPQSTRAAGAPRTVVRPGDLQRIGPAYWWIVLMGALLTLARFSEAFLVLRAEHVGLSVTFIPLVMVVMSVTYAAWAYPAGKLADRMSRRPLLVVGCLFLIMADVILAVAGDVAMVMVGVALWGMHMGLTQGLLATLIADASQPELRGSAFGVFSFVCGVSLLLASVLAGFLWDQFGPSATFFAGAALTALALLGFVVHKPDLPPLGNG